MKRGFCWRVLVCKICSVGSVLLHCWKVQVRFSPFCYGKQIMGFVFCLVDGKDTLCSLGWNSCLSSKLIRFSDFVAGGSGWISWYDGQLSGCPLLQFDVAPVCLRRKGVVGQESVMGGAESMLHEFDVVEDYCWCAESVIVCQIGIVRTPYELHRWFRKPYGGNDDGSCDLSRKLKLCNRNISNGWNLIDCGADTCRFARSIN
ncbi:hypothetical protein HN51_033274 [Arachis hypogaea]